MSMEELCTLPPTVETYYVHAFSSTSEGEYEKRPTYMSSGIAMDILKKSSIKEQILFGKECSFYN